MSPLNGNVQRVFCCLLLNTATSAVKNAHATGNNMTGHNPYADYLALLVATQPQTLYLRDGELIVYRRPKTLHYQCRFKLSPDKWTRRSTGAASVEQAVANACLLYDEARFRHRLGLAQQAQDIAHIARIACGELRQEIDKRQRKSSYNDYVRIIERDFVAYFGERRIEELTRNDIKQFETWRDRRNQRTPTASTLNNYAAAWSRLVKTAVEHGYISESTSQTNSIALRMISSLTVT